MLPNIITRVELHANSSQFYFAIMRISNTLKTNWADTGTKWPNKPGDSKIRAWPVLGYNATRPFASYFFCWKRSWEYSFLKGRLQYDDRNLNPKLMRFSAHLLLARAVASGEAGGKIRDFPETVGWTTSKSCRVIKFGFLATANLAGVQCRRSQQHDRNLCRIFTRFGHWNLRWR